MSGNPAFQGSAFQNSAFQAGAIVVAANYDLGSPSFATPTLGYKYVFSTAAYSLGSPVFATPTMATAPDSTLFHANPYSLGSPTFALPAMRLYQTLHANAYAVASPSFAFPRAGQNYYFYTNAMSLSSPAFSTPMLERNFQFLAPVYWLGSPDFASNLAILVNRVLHIPAEGYSLGKLGFGFPRLQASEVFTPWSRTYFSQTQEAANLLDTLLNYILMSLPPGQTPQRDYCRRLVTTLRSDPAAAIRGDTLGTDLQNIYAAADAADCTYAGIEAARGYLMSQTGSTSAWVQAVLNSALVMTLGEECTLVTRMTFPSQGEVQTMILHMRDAFEQATELGIDELDVTVYRTINAMGGAIMNYLARVELQLPRYMAYRAAAPWPSLYLAQRIYADPTRADQIEAENGVVHPAFCPVNLRILALPPVGGSSLAFP